MFLMVQNPSDANPSEAPISKFYLVTRNKTGQHIYQVLGDPAPNYGLNRSPPHHFLLRLREYPPDLTDILIVGSSASTDIGLFTRSRKPLTQDKPATEVTDVYTLTEMADDSRRAALPVSDTMEDTSPIGMAIDYSAIQNVVKPIPGDEMTMSASPLPGFFVLNNEGVLASWWVVYNDAVRQGLVYPNLNIATEKAASQPAATAFGTPAAPSAFGQSAFGASTSSNSAFGAKPAFGSSAFGASTGSAFGAPSGLNSKPSVWGSPASSGATSGAKPAFGAPAFGAPAFGAPAFGSPAFGSTSTSAATGAAFGATSAPGQRASPWGTAAAAPAFGQSSLTPAKPAVAPFSAPTSGGFASFAKAPSGFSGLASGSPSTENVFGAKAGGSAFGALAKPAESASIFGQPQPVQAGSAFGSGGGFKLTSSFKPDASATEKDDKNFTSGSGSFFGGGFGKILGEVKDAAAEAVAEETMEDEPAGPAAQPSASGFAVNGLAGNINKEEKSEATPLSNIFGAKPASSPFALPKKEPVEEKPISTIPEAPLPPDPTSKTEFRIGDSSASSQSADAPLPPDFTKPAAPKLKDAPLPPDFVNQQAPKSPDAPLPPDSFSAKPITKTAAPESSSVDKQSSSSIFPPLGGADSDDEEDFTEFSSDDEEQEIEQAAGEETKRPDSRGEEDNNSEWTPGSSFNGSPLATKSRVQQPTSRPLFGEIGNKNVPVFAPPKVQESPRSPSPVRSAVPAHLRSRPDVSRSVSAPLKASEILGNRPPPEKPEYTDTLEFRQAEERRRVEERERKEREEAQALIDEDDERNQRYLDQEIEPSKVLDEFITREDYIADATKDSVPFQVEALFRDINSMIDTLGMNARSLQSFIAGHTENADRERTREDLREPETWCLGEVDDLDRIVERDLMEILEDGSVQDVSMKLKICAELERDVGKLRLRRDEFVRTFSTALDPEHAIICRSQPLTAEQAAHQHSLRREFGNIQKLVADAEEALVLLRTKVASAANPGRGGSGPTVEAVMRTVKKLTAMAEKRSGDVDVLENQMRRMRFGSTIRDDRSRENSPFNTPSKLASRLGNMSLGGDRPFTPEGSMFGSRAFHNSFSASMRSQGNGTPRKKMANYTCDERQRLKENVVKRREVANRVKAALEKSGARVYPMED